MDLRRFVLAKSGRQLFIFRSQMDKESRRHAGLPDQFGGILRDIGFGSRTPEQENQQADVKREAARASHHGSAPDEASGGKFEGCSIVTT
jgi:hypothetical protein